MATSVERVESPRAWRDFLALPRAIYARDPGWVPPIEAEVRRTLDAARNPYFIGTRLAVFLVRRGSEPVARACAVVNPAHARRFGQRTAFFGFYESLDDPDATGALFDAVSGFCREEGAEALEGPFNPNHYSELGLQLDGFDRPPVFFETHNPAYYLSLLAAAGFVPRVHLHTRANPDVGTYIRRRYGDPAPPAGQDGFTVRPFRLWDLRRELERVRAVYNDAFTDNWHFLPLTAEEYRFSAAYLFLVSYPRLVAIVEHRGEPVGVAQCALDVNPLLRRLNGRAGPLGLVTLLARRRRIRDVVLFAAGVRRAYRSSIAYRLLVDYVGHVLRDARVLTTTWMTDDNAAALGGAARFGLQRSKSFAIYGRPL